MEKKNKQTNKTKQKKKKKKKTAFLIHWDSKNELTEKTKSFLRADFWTFAWVVYYI